MMWPSRQGKMGKKCPKHFMQVVILACVAGALLILNIKTLYTKTDSTKARNLDQRATFEILTQSAINKKSLTFVRRDNKTRSKFYLALTQELHQKFVRSRVRTESVDLKYQIQFDDVFGTNWTFPEKHLGQYHWLSADINPYSTQKRAYFLSVFYDSRLHHRHYVTIRTSISCTYDVGKQRQLNALAWYGPYAVVCPCTFTVVPNLLGNINYFNYNVKCTVPTNAPKTPPQYVSFTHFPQSKPTNIAIPEYLAESLKSFKRTAGLHATSQTNSTKIGVCGMNIYGNFGLEQAIYFVNWMEALLMFGVSDVTWNNLNVRFTHSLGEKVFQYYTERNQLVLYRYQPVYDKLNVSGNMSGTGIEYSHTNYHMILSKCLYSQMQSHWLTLPIDLDEIIVPRDGSRTYQEFLENFSKTERSIESYTNIGACARPFYMSAPVDESKPKHLTLFNHNKHGYINNPCKTFRNPKTCAFPLIHVCSSLYGELALERKAKHKGQKFDPVEESRRIRKRTSRDVLVISNEKLSNYHFRSSCKQNIVANCTQEKQDLKQDDYFYETYGDELRKRVESVFDILGFDYSSL